MAQLKRLLASLSLQQRIFTLAVVLALGAGIYTLAHWRAEADFKPLVTSLSAEDSAAVVQKVKESGAEYRLSDTGTVISVPSAKLAEMRLELAAAGLPKTGRIGFEIFDKSNLGATDFVEHVNYRRALEGELERSLMAMAGVERARVHVTFPKDSVFLDSREPGKASVMLAIKPGVRLSERNVAAVGHLVASAVEGLLPAAVSVLDMQGNLLSRQMRSPDEEASENALEYRQKLERDLIRKIGDTLDPLLGHDHYRAGVSVDCDLTSGEQSEETLDPSKSVMLSSQKTEDVTSGGSSGGVPGSASNLPRPTSRPNGSAATTTRRTENVNYESSRTIRKMKLPQGGIKRITAAVLLDQTVRWEGQGKSVKRVLDPPSPETLKTVKDVVAAVVGFSQDRGDQITVESLPFETTLNQQPPGEPAPVGAPAAQRPLVNWKDWSQNRFLVPAAIGAAVLLLLGAGAVIWIRKRARAGNREASASMQAALPQGTDGKPSTAAEQMQAQLAEHAAAQERADLAALASIKVPQVKTRKSEVLTKQLRENANKDVTTSVHVLQTWIRQRN